jgi:hypothetical protein
VPPKLFKGSVAVLLVAIAVLAVAAWARDGESARGEGSPSANAADHYGASGRASVPRLDLAKANRALAAAAPGLKVRISRAELESDDYPSGEAQPGAYAPAPSTAEGMTHEWHKYAAMVDRSCALSYNYMLALKARAAQVAYRDGWTEERAVATDWRLTSDEDARILRATAVLGQPPTQQRLFASWRGNVRERTRLFLAASRAAAAGDFALAQRICARILRLKNKADQLGQRFGLRICTSN